MADIWYLKENINKKSKNPQRQKVYKDKILVFCKYKICRDKKNKKQMADENSVPHPNPKNCRLWEAGGREKK